MAEIIKLKAEIKLKKTIQRINKSKLWFFEKIKKVDKPLAILRRGHRDSIQINKIRNKNGDITTEFEEIQKKSLDPTTKAFIQQNWRIWMK